ncbi:ead/Ea22-like family protein [Enterobacter hormaechei]|nr:ead/Ea22-like family protein [Enterobacter hormaechei]
MSNIDKQALRERYSAKPTPKCHICGTEMTVQRMSASRITYGCTGATYGDTGCHYAAGRSIADDHYEQSRVTIVDVSDPDVLALLDELEAMHKYAKDRDAENEGLMLTVGRLRVEKEAAEKRIAEMQAREVKLPKPISVLHRRDFGDAHRSIYAYPEAEVNAALSDAGIRIHGED